MSDIGLQMKSDSRAPRGPRHRFRGLLAVALSLAVIGLIGYAIYWGISQFQGISGPPDDYAGEGKGTVAVEVKKGQTLAQIGQTLKKEGVVATVDAFLAEAKAEPKIKSIGPGSYTMALEMSAAAAVARLIDPASRMTDKFLLREGLRLWETLAKISKSTGLPMKDLEEAAADGKAIGLPKYAQGFAEGFMFPATYEFDQGVPATQILSKLVERYGAAAGDIRFESRARKQGVSPHEALIVASLVQAEGHPDDFRKVARVIYNRLDPDTWGGTYGLLQMDATVNYALKSSEINLTEDQLKNTESKYNTYKYPGLPPTPINSPGQEAMEAAVNPAKGDWLYYVTVNPDTGKTKFTDNYKEFLKFKAELSEFLKNKG